jgi:hypothetical protein
VFVKHVLIQHVTGQPIFLHDTQSPIYLGTLTTLESECPSGGPPCFVVGPAATLVNYTYTCLKITLQFRLLCIPLIAVFTRAVANQLTITLLPIATTMLDAPALERNRKNVKFSAL